MKIRPSTPDDYPAITEIRQATWPDEGDTAEALTEEDGQRDPIVKFLRLVAERDGQVIGVAQHDQLVGRYHPGKFWLQIEVHPRFQRQGVGGALYDSLMAALATHDPLLARVAFRDDMGDCRRFLEMRGFQEDWHSWELELDLNIASPSAALAARVEEKLRSEAIEIRTYGELARDAARDQKLYDLYEETRQDATFWDPATPMGYERFIQFTRSSWNPEAYFVATRGEEYVGLSALQRGDPGGPVDTGWTGIRRGFRRQGIGLALKLRALEYARAAGYSAILTTVNSRNQGSLAINERMGFARRYAWIYYVK
ncbi:MAG TPA: GNAT family N-acetyltransferase, partial [Ardenticatenaceae bacterium]|nr:GNAT family N-acetyltransferase [Ardenticatenaceae bacterium]